MIPKAIIIEIRKANLINNQIVAKLKPTWWNIYFDLNLKQAKELFADLRQVINDVEE